RHRLIHQREVRRAPALLRRDYAVLVRVSPGYPLLLGRFLCVTHPSAARRLPEGIVSARLACVRPAASVQSEPGSNSPVYTYYNWCMIEIMLSMSKRLNLDAQLGLAFAIRWSTHTSYLQIVKDR